MIPVKLESEEDKYMLIHGYTGAIDVVTENLLNQIKRIGTENTLSEGILHILQKRGYITNKTKEEEYAYVNRMANALHKKSNILYSTFTWVVTYNCNFRCPYCYESRERKDGKQQIVFNRKQVDKAYKAINNIQPHKELRSNQIILYGGEPLLAENKDIISYIVEEGVKQGYKFEAVTNGYELESFVDLLDKSKIFRLQITVDGPKDIHDQRRIHFLHNNTFDKIIKNIQLALDKNIQVNVRMNTDNNNIKYFAELKDFFEQKGFFSYSNFVLYSAIIENNSSITSLEQESLNFISAQSYIEQHKQYKTISLCQDYGIFNSIYSAIQKKLPIKFNSVFCSAQSSGYVLDPLGNIYPCWEVVGQKEYLLGTYTANDIHWNENTVTKWRQNSLTLSNKCQHCRYALLCKGGCPFKSINPQEQTSQCTFFQEIFKTTVNRAYIKANKNSLIN